MRGERGFWLWVLAASGSFVVLVALLAPRLDVNKRQRGNESVTVARLRQLSEFQNSYAASYPAKGFSCQLDRLKPNKADDDTYDPNRFLLTGEQSGYKFEVTGCRTDPNGAVTQYQVTAIPLEPGKTGFRAFCMDQTRSIWYDAGGSADHCLATRRPLE